MEKYTITKRHSNFFLFESFRPVAASTPYEIQQNLNSPRHPRFTPPVYCSTPKQSRRPPVTFSLPRKLSQRRLQFPINSTNVKNLKIWLL